jgi:hypothetical protein
VIYRYGRIDSWFFNGRRSKKGGIAPLVLRKRQFSVRHAGVMERIETAMGADKAATNDVVAVWIAGEPGELSIVLHLTKYSLHQFLNNVPDKGHGILQRFVQPFGGRNALVRSVSTPHHFGIEYRTNWYATTDHRIMLAPRLATFEGGVRHVNTSAVNRHLLEEVEEASLDIMTAIDKVHGPHYKKARRPLTWTAPHTRHYFDLSAQSQTTALRSGVANHAQFQTRHGGNDLALKLLRAQARSRRRGAWQWPGQHRISSR